MSPIPDEIVKTVFLPVPIERVWRALTDPDDLARWFGDSAVVDLRPGGELVFGWGAKTRVQARVEEVLPPYRFSYRWQVYGPDPGHPLDRLHTTLVSFGLEAVPGGTRLTVVESGFAALTPEVARPSREANDPGWDEELAELLAFATAVAAGPGGGG